MTNNEAVSKIINSFKLLNKDERVSRRYVLRLLRDSAKNLISQKLLDRTISEEQNLYSKVDCFEFEKVEVISCPIIEFRKCSTLMRSKKPLPELVFSRNGASIKEVVSVDDLTEIYLTTPDQYRRDRKRKYYHSTDTYLYIDTNNYEIIIDNGTTAVSITVPSGLTSKIGIGFTQKGTGDVAYIASGTTINNPIGLKIKGQYYQTFLSQELATNNFFLGGNTKI